ncbi:MAG: F0F1 ATP synthase subunit B [Chloroflexi bacterium]|nr:F0F1 ATP synthase subunit B [Chloroflexota bacterium]
MEALGINLGYVLLQIFMFAIVLVVLRQWVYIPVLGLLDRRSKAIAQGLEDARVASEARANAEKDAEKIIAETQTKAALMIREASERAEAAGREIKAAADAEIAKEREAAMQEVEIERNQILGELRTQVISLAIAAAHKLISDAMDEKRQRELLEEFFSGVRAGRVVVLDGAAMDGAMEDAEVTSALPLTQDEQDAICRDILGRAVKVNNVNFRVDPSLLGGLVVRVGDKIMDGSLAGQLQNLRQNLS